MSGFRSKASRELFKAVQNAGGSIERMSTGRIRITGPDGVVTIHEPSGDTRKDLLRSSAYKLITEKTGLAV
jgi:hypothetical protein